MSGEDIRLLFFGTFFHENTELTADLIQLKQAARITEIRVIPLGATVDLSTGAFQLGATNPSEFVIEFYFNDLQVPSKSTFELLRHFDFHDKSRIQLNCEPADIVTDGILVRGIYSTVTLAIYGYGVDQVVIKEVEEKVAAVVAAEPVPLSSSIDSPVTLESNSPCKTDIEEHGDCLSDRRGGEPSHIHPELSFPHTTVSTPPSSTPRATVEYEPNIVDDGEEGAHGEAEMEERREEECVVATVLAESSELPFDPDVMDTEDISDGEVFPSDEEAEGNPYTARSPLPSVSGKVEELDADAENRRDDEGKDSGSEEVSQPPPPRRPPLLPIPFMEAEPICSPPQEDQSSQSGGEGSLSQEGTEEAGFEEIISDEEMDFPDYEYEEWEENWGHKLSRSFNPFSDSFQVHELQNVGFDSELGSQESRNSYWDTLEDLCKKYSRRRFSPALYQGWVECMEKALTIIPQAMSSRKWKSTPATKEIQGTLLFWVEVGLNFELAMDQSSLAYKTRHLKVGIKLVQSLANSCTKGREEERLMGELLRVCVPPGGGLLQQVLMDLLAKPHMSNANKLLILRSLDATISSQEGFLMFTTPGKEELEESCYQRLLQLILNPGVSTRISFSLRSLLNKLKLMEGLWKLERLVKSPVNIEAGTEELEIFTNLLSTANHVDQYFALPLRMLPAKHVVELPSITYAGHDPKHSFVSMLREMKFLQSSAALISNKSKEIIIERVISPMAELLTIILGWEGGLVYLCNEADATTSLIKCLVSYEEECSSNIGCLMVHCMELMHCVDIFCGEHSCEEVSTEDADDEDLHLQTAFSFLSTSIGRTALLTTLTKGNFVLPFLSIFKAPTNCEGSPEHRELWSYIATARQGYALEILEFLIKHSESVEFLMKHGQALYQTISSADELILDGGGGSEKIGNIKAFLKPVLNPIAFTLDGIEGLCSMIKLKQPDLLPTTSSRTGDNNWGYPPDIITAFRILAELGVDPEENDTSKLLSLSASSDELLIRQLQFELVLVKIHSFDITSTITSILQRIADDFSQPLLSSYAFVSSRGDALFTLLLPMLRLLKRLVAKVIQVRKTEFRDTTAVPVLLRIYGLMDFVPSYALAFSKAEEVCQLILGILLCYTIPSIKQGSETEDELNKSTWSAVIKEIIKYTLESPAHFQGGLVLLSELLPLPLPMPTNRALSKDACAEAIKLRRLWSAYIHGLTAQVQEMIKILSSSTNSRLVKLLRRVCIQLADLSASTCLVVCRAILDSYAQSLEGEGEETLTLIQPSQSQSSECTQDTAVKAWVDCATAKPSQAPTPYSARVLSFMASLLSSSPGIKCGLAQVLKGNNKMDEKYCELLSTISSTLAPSMGSEDAHAEAQSDCPKNEEEGSALPSSLSHYFTNRAVYIVVDKQSDPAYSTLPPAFSLPDAEGEETDLVSCDLEELCSTHLNGFDLAAEVQKLAKADSSHAHPQHKSGVGGSSSTHRRRVSGGGVSSRARHEGGGRLPTPHSHPHLSLSQLHRRPHYGSIPGRGAGGLRGMFTRAVGGRGLYDPFRSRPPNTSRPPSLHVDDFVAMGQGLPQMQMQQQLRTATAEPPPPPYGRGRGSSPRGITYSPGRRGAAAAPAPAASASAVPLRGGGPPFDPYSRSYESSPTSMQMQPRPIRGGRVFSTPNSDRWTADNRAGVGQQPRTPRSKERSNTKSFNR